MVKKAVDVIKSVNETIKGEQVVVILISLRMLLKMFKNDVEVNLGTF